MPAGKNKGLQASGHKRSAVTVKFDMPVFKGFCTWLVAEGMLLKHPMDRLKHPTSKKARRAQFCLSEKDGRRG